MEDLLNEFGTPGIATLFGNCTKQIIQGEQKCTFIDSTLNTKLFTGYENVLLYVQSFYTNLTVYYTFIYSL